MGQSYVNGGVKVTRDAAERYRGVPVTIVKFVKIGDRFRIVNDPIDRTYIRGSYEKYIKRYICHGDHGMVALYANTYVYLIKDTYLEDLEDDI